MCAGVDRAKETYEGLYYPPTPRRSCQPLPLAGHKQKPRQGSLFEAVEVSSWGTARMERGVHSGSGGGDRWRAVNTVSIRGRSGID